MALFDVHEFAANRSSSYSVNDLKGQQSFTAGDERRLLATDNSAELLDLQAERIVIWRNVTLDLEWLEPATLGLIGPEFEARRRYDSSSDRCADNPGFRRLSAPNSKARQYYHSRSSFRARR